MKGLFERMDRSSPPPTSTLLVSAGALMALLVVYGVYMVRPKPIPIPGEQGSASASLETTGQDALEFDLGSAVNRDRSSVESNARPESSRPPDMYSELEKTSPRRLIPAGLEELKRARDSDEQEEFVDELIYQALALEDPNERETAVWELGGQDRTDKVVWACLRALHDSDPGVRIEAVQALEILTDPSALAQLHIVATQDPDESVREAAGDAWLAIQRAD